MLQGAEAKAVGTRRDPWDHAGFRGYWFLWLGGAILALPTLIALAQQYWAYEQGAHGPIVLATGIWLIARRRSDIAALARPGSGRLATLVIVPSLIAYILARNTGMLGIECLAVYAVFLGIVYYHVGFAALRPLCFPLIYFLFMFPEPEVITLPLSRALKLLISTGAVDALSVLGYQVARGGVVMYVDQYELLVATACSGLNSLIGLSAIGTFYAYIRHDGRWRASLPLLLVIPFIAIAANFVRVVVLMLITHYFGASVGEGFVHDFAGIFMFMVAVTLMLGVDGLITAFGARFAGRRAT